MLKKFYLPALLAAAVMAPLASCSDDDDSNNGPDAPVSAKEAALKPAAQAYIDHTVLPTYASMADAAVTLADLCGEIQSKHAAGTLTTADITAAGSAWMQARKSWELSEAFLFGPAANHNIDPHIDSWPLDKMAMDNLLADIKAGKPWDITNNGGYGLLGFHSIEYMLYELSADGNTSKPHSTDYTPAELTYLTAVADDLRDQCVLLEACWAGSDALSATKRNILEEAELDYGENFGWEMKHAGEAGSHFKTFQEVAEEIIQGCIDIADEVGNTKIGRPHMGSSEEDKNYIESPYSLNSIEDFVDNIRSIENSYFGARSGDASISAYIKTVNPDLDAEMRRAIDAAIAAISAIPEPFAKSASGAQAAAAVEACGSDLVDVLEEVYSALGK